MDSGELKIKGKKFISSKRGALLVSYTQDYVGQLARAGLVEATQVGRSWYVSEESILLHKKQNPNGKFSGRKRKMSAVLPVASEMKKTRLASVSPKSSLSAKNVSVYVP